MKKLYMSAWTVTKQSVLNFIEDDCFSHASAIAFYTIFSMPAILIIVLGIGSAFYEEGLVQQELLNQVSNLIGDEGSKEVERILLRATIDSTSVFARVVGIATLAFSATTVFISLQTSLNIIWGIKPKPLRGLIKYIVNRLLSLAMVFSIGFVLLVSLVVDTLLVVFQGMLSRLMDGFTLVFITAVNYCFSFAIVTIIFSLLFKILPDATIRWKDVWIGSAATTLLFTVGKFLIGLYLGNSTFSSAYGTAGSLVIILLWVYYSVVIFLLGAEITYEYARESGSEIRPYTNAVKVKTIEVESEGKTVGS